MSSVLLLICDWRTQLNADSIEGSGTAGESPVSDTINMYSGNDSSLGTLEQHVTCIAERINPSSTLMTLIAAIWTCPRLVLRRRLPIGTDVKLKHVKPPRSSEKSITGLLSQQTNPILGLSDDRPVLEYKASLDYYTIT